MTEAEVRQAEIDAEADAKRLGLMLVLALRDLGVYTSVKSITFDIKTGAFYVNGVPVARETIRLYLDRLERFEAARFEALINDLEKRQIEIDEWKRQHDRRIRSMHVLAASLALGGIAQAIRSSRVHGLINEQIQYADKFEKAVRAGKAGTFQRMKWRARSYANSARITHSIIEQTARERFGSQTECRRFRRASESCEGCIKWARKGWIPINLMPPLGTQPCRNNCKCFLIYR